MRIMTGILIVWIMVSIASCGVYSHSGDSKKDSSKEKSAAIEKAETEEIAEDKVEQPEQEALQEQQDQDQLAKSLGLELVTVPRVVDGDTFLTSDGRKI